MGGDKESIMEIDPSVVYFTFSRVRPLYSCGRKISDTIEAVQRGELQAKDLPKIQVLYDSSTDNYFSMNNRRLYTFKKLHELGCLPSGTVPARVKPVPQTRRMAEKYTAAKCSLTATLMGMGKGKAAEGDDDDEVTKEQREQEEEVREKGDAKQRPVATQANKAKKKGKGKKGHKHACSSDSDDGGRQVGTDLASELAAMGLSNK